MRRHIIAAVMTVAAGAGAMAGCTADTAGTDHDVPNAPANPVDQGPAEMTAPATDLSPRGMIPLEVGQVATIHDIYGNTGAPVLRFSLDEINYNQQCLNPDAYDTYEGEGPENGHYIGLHLNIETTADFNPMQATHSMDTSGFIQQTPDGYTNTHPTSTWSNVCTPSDLRLPYASDMVASSRYRALVILDVAETDGILMYRTMAGEGWEWQLEQ